MARASRKRKRRARLIGVLVVRREPDSVVADEYEAIAALYRVYGDEPAPARSRVATEKYRRGWDRVFGRGKPVAQA